MKILTRENLEWNSTEGIRRALVHNESLGGTQVQLEMLEIGSGQTIKPHTHQKRREFLVVVHASGAQIRLGDRVFRPLAGQAFEREPGEIMEIVNDGTQPTRILITQIGFDPADVQNA
jgi:uncharacterized RmlC-like cupin family protein